MKNNLVQVSDYFYVVDTSLVNPTFDIPLNAYIYSTIDKALFIKLLDGYTRIITFNDDGIITDGYIKAGEGIYANYDKDANVSLVGNRIKLYTKDNGNLYITMLEDVQKYTLELTDADDNVLTDIVVTQDTTTINNNVKVKDTLTVSYDKPNNTIIDGSKTLLTNSNNYTAEVELSDSNKLVINLMDDNGNTLNTLTTDISYLDVLKSLRVYSKDSENNTVITDNTIVLNAKDFYSMLSQHNTNKSVKLNISDKDDNELGSLDLIVPDNDDDTTLDYKKENIVILKVKYKGSIVTTSKEIYVGTDDDGTNGYLVWNENNDGPDSGLNADLLDDRQGIEYQLVKNMIDEDDMSSDSDTKYPTQQSVKAYVDNTAGGTNVVKDDDYTAVSGNVVWCDTATNGAWTLTLPDNPDNFDWVKIIDYKANFDDDNLTVDRNGSTIMGVDEDLIIDTENAVVKLQVIDGDWRIV